MIPFGFWGQSDEAEIIQDGLILYMDALDPASYPGSGVIWEDLVNGIDGELQNGPTWNASGYFTFDGVNDRLELLGTTISTYQFGTGNFTMSCWVYIPNLNKIWNLFSSKDTSNFAEYKFGYGTTSGLSAVSGKRMYYVFIDNDVSDGRAVHSSELSSAILDNWVHLTFVRDASRDCKLYANGSLLTNTATSNFGSSAFSVGSNSNWIFSGDTGDISDFNSDVAMIYWYNRALSGSEVLENFETHKNRFGL